MTSGETEFLDYLAALHLVEWEELVEAVVEGSSQALEIFRPLPQEDLASHLARFVERLGRQERVSFCRALERVLLSLIADPAGAAVALSHAFDLAARIADRPVLGILEGFVRDSRFGASLRVDAANALANHAGDVPDSFWLDLDSVALPSLAPAIVNGLTCRSPMLALKALHSMPQGPPEPEVLEYPLRMTLRKLAQDAGWLSRLVELQASAPPWLGEALTRTLALHEFAPQLAESASSTAHQKSAELVFETWRTALELYLAGTVQSFAFAAWQGETIIGFWERLIEDWKPTPLRESADLRLIKLLPVSHSRALLVKLLGEFKRAEALDTPPGERLSDRLVGVLWERLVAYEGTAMLLATSAAEHDRYIFQAFLQTLRKTLRNPRLGISALRLLVRHSLHENLSEVVRAALEYEHVSAALCWSLLEGEVGAREADRILKEVVRMLSGTSIAVEARRQWPTQGSLIEGTDRAVALKLMAFNRQLFVVNVNVSPAAHLDLDDSTSPSTMRDLERSVLQRFH